VIFSSGKPSLFRPGGDLENKKKYFDQFEFKIHYSVGVKKYSPNVYSPFLCNVFLGKQFLYALYTFKIYSFSSTWYFTREHSSRVYIRIDICLGNVNNNINNELQKLYIYMLQRK